MRRIVPSLLAAALLLPLIAAPPRQAKASIWPDAVDRIRTELASPDASRRRSAAEGLASLPLDRAKPMFDTALIDSDVEVRLAAMSSAARANFDVAERVLPWLTDADARLREGACLYFGKRPQVKVVKVVSRALGDTEVRVRIAAVRALGVSAAPEAVAPLLARLDDVSSKVRLEVARALGQLGDKRAVTPLVSKVQDEAPEVRQAVVRALGDLGDPRAAPALGIALRDAATEVRIDALGALGRLRAVDAVPSIVPLLAETKRPGSAETRRAALAALGRIGTAEASAAIIRSFGLDDDDGAGVRQSAARDAAVLAGGTSAAPLLAMLRDGVPTPPKSVLKPSGLPPTSLDVAASAAHVISVLATPGAADAIIRAMRRADLAPAPALHALGVIGDVGSLAVCLEHVTSSDAETRREALFAVAHMLDPETPDGRAVEPLLAALRHAQDEIVSGMSGSEERAVSLAAEIAMLLGRTGAGRVAPVLIGLTAAKEERLRLSAIDALGMLGDAAGGPTLVKLLDDRSGTARLRAGIALGRAGGVDVLKATLDRASGTLQADRLSVAIALIGMLARVGDDAAVGRVRDALGEAGGERDLLLVAIGRSKAKGATAILATILARPSIDVDARRAIAAALGARAGEPAALIALRALASDADASVRAQAAWSLGAVGTGIDDVARLEGLAADPAMAAAANAVAGLGRIGARMPAGTAPSAAICGALGDGRAYVRANALGALLQLQRAGRPSICGDGARAIALLDRDGDEVVRAFAARFLGKIATTTTAPEHATFARAALDRCTIADPSGAVAQCCRNAIAGERAVSAGEHALVVFVAPDDGGAPVPRSAYAIERPEGLLHLGTTDRRASVVELGLGNGDVRLRVAIPTSTASRE